MPLAARYYRLSLAPPSDSPPRVVDPRGLVFLVGDFVFFLFAEREFFLSRFFGVSSGQSQDLVFLSFFFPLFFGWVTALLPSSVFLGLPVKLLCDQSLICFRFVPNS